MALFTWEDNHPTPDEYGKFYEGYINLVNGSNVLQMLIEQGQKTFTLIQRLTPDEADHRYKKEKWSVKEVIGHLIDTERIMAYRALSIARGEKKSLPGYDQDDYVAHASFDARTLQSLSAEYDAQRNANINLFSSFDEGHTQRRGTANGMELSVRALVHIIVGHEKHHLKVLREKYNIDISSD